MLMVAEGSRAGGDSIRIRSAFLVLAGDTRLWQVGKANMRQKKKSIGNAALGAYRHAAPIGHDGHRGRTKYGKSRPGRAHKTTWTRPTYRHPDSAVRGKRETRSLQGCGGV